jgi:hypothetical protein
MLDIKTKKQMNLLIFHLAVDFGEDLTLVANNEVDLENHLIEKGFTNIKFEDLRTTYGTCTFRTQYGTEVAKCFYATKI